MARYPSIYAGQRITGTLMQSMLPDVIWKTANEDRAATTTLANDSDLVATLEANATYHVTMYIHFASLEAAQFQTQWAVPTGATGNRSAAGAAYELASSGAATSQAANGGYHRSGVHGFSTSVRYGTRASATNQALALEEAIVTTSSTAGTLALMWAQVTSNATATRVGAGSSMHIRRLA
ncbi:hypothetical protein ACH5A7_20785 [Streptomyces sp. NPDC018955]|uniref:hypothetical protein n=1 Tax=Streptomyces sp. NPDC018955 TaxID=3365055 RepID=UPI003791D764